MNKEYYMAEFDGIRHEPLTDVAMANYLSLFPGNNLELIKWWGIALRDSQILEINKMGEALVPKESKYGYR